jgi:hypothetical protein
MRNHSTKHLLDEAFKKIRHLEEHFEQICDPHRGVTFTVQGVTVLLLAHQVLKMSTAINVGQTLSLAISFLDQAGSPMLTTPTPDSPPTWTQSNAAAETLAVAADGLTAVGTPVAAGIDTITLTVMVGGVSFSATLEVDVAAVAPPAQVLTSVAITPTVS